MLFSWYSLTIVVYNHYQDYYFFLDGDGMDCPEVWARIAVLNGQSQAAEALYLEQNQVEKAIQMYLSLHKWENGNARQIILIYHLP